MKRERLLKTSDDYEIYLDSIDDSKVFAVKKTEITKIDNLLKQFNYLYDIPNDFTINCLRVDKVKESEQFDEYDIVDYNPISVQINKLISAGIKRK